MRPKCTPHWHDAHPFRERLPIAYLTPAVRRSGGLTDQECRLMLDQAIVTGRGGALLRLTAEQHTNLKD